MLNQHVKAATKAPPQSHLFGLISLPSKKAVALLCCLIICHQSCSYFRKGRRLFHPCLMSPYLFLGLNPNVPFLIPASMSLPMSCIIVLEFVLPICSFSLKHHIPAPNWGSWKYQRHITTGVLRSWSYPSSPEARTRFHTIVDTNGRSFHCIFVQEMP